MQCTALELNSAVCMRFRVVDPAPYPNVAPLPDRREMFVKFIELCCAKPLVLNLERLSSDISRLYCDTNKSAHLVRLAPIAKTLKTDFGMTEPYAFVFAHLLLYSFVFFQTVANADNLADAEKTQITHATYVCARYMREDFTEFVFELLQFNLYTNIFPATFIRFLTHYMTILNKDHHGVLPKW